MMIEPALELQDIPRVEYLAVVEDAREPGEPTPWLVQAVEAVLFVSDGPVTLQEIARALGVGEGQAEQALDVFSKRIGRHSSLELARIAGGYQLCTRPEFAQVVSAFLSPQNPRLGKSLLEVLAVVAYRQPVTLSEIERVRGVQSDYGVRGLLERRLIREVGRKKAPGRPMLYGTTQQFLHQFNLADLSDLPRIERGSNLATDPQPEHSE